MTKKFYLRVFFHLIDMILVAAWVSYREDTLAEGLAKKEIPDLIGF